MPEDYNMPWVLEFLEDLTAQRIEDIRHPEGHLLREVVITGSNRPEDRMRANLQASIERRLLKDAKDNYTLLRNMNQALTNFAQKVGLPLMFMPTAPLATLGWSFGSPAFHGAALAIDKKVGGHTADNIVSGAELGLMALGAGAGAYAGGRALLNNTNLGRAWLLSRAIGRGKVRETPTFRNNISYYTPNSPSLQKYVYPWQQPSRSTLTEAERLGIPKGERNFKPRWHVANYPGYLLKVLMRGSPLEKALSKTGQVNINSINAATKNASNIEREVINKVLAEKFSGQKTIDYNLFKKAVLDELITFNRKPQNKYSTYGMDRLGFNKVEEPDGAGGILEYIPGVATNTFTLESPRIPQGNAAHYDPTTLMHSRTFTTPEEPNILHVLEGLSDAALHTPRPINLMIVNATKKRISLAEQLLEDFRSFPEKYLDININEEAIENFINKQRSVIDAQRLGARIFTGQEKYLFNNNLSKIIQENLKFASERGQTKMRYPTRDTAVKIEGFLPKNTVSLEYELMLKDVQNYNILEDIINEEYGKLRFPKVRSSGDNSYLIDSETGLTDIQIGADGKPYRVPVGQGVDYHYIVNVPDFGNLVYEMPKVEIPKEWQDYLDLEQMFLSSLKNVNKLRRRIGTIKYEGLPDFTPDLLTILKKYEDFPKLFLKLFKDLEIRTVTDANGNTWYEVDVPKGYLSREWQYKNGGKLISVYKPGGKMNIIEKFKEGRKIHIKKENRGKFTEYCGGKVTSECIARGKNSSDPAVRKRATFADNARHFKHKSGGPVFRFYGNNIMDSDADAYKYVKKKYKLRGAANGAKLDLINLGGTALNGGIQLFSGLKQAGALEKQLNSQVDLEYLNRISNATNQISNQYDNYWKNLVNENALKRALGLPVENLSPIVLRWGRAQAINNATSGLKAWKDLAKSLNKIQANQLQQQNINKFVTDLGTNISNFISAKNNTQASN